MGKEGSVGEKGSDGLEGSFGKTGVPGLPGRPGTPSYEIIYDSSVKYANEEKNDHGDYGNEEADNQSVAQWKHSSDQISSEVNNF